MGQIFHACAYDIETKTCCVIDADKFHANCYSFCGTVLSMHYLLRQKPYRIIWGGDYISLDDNLERFVREEDLLGISAFWNVFGFDMNSEEIRTKSYFDKIKFINENSKSWKKLDVWDEAEAFFDWETTHSVKYSGYLLNHTKKLAVDLADYYEQSKYYDKSIIELAIDLIPVLTETGGGTLMALFDGISAETTEELAGVWCGDLLQIVGELPDDYQLINCCFAGIWSRAQYCFYMFGTNNEGFLLSNDNGKLFEASSLNIRGKRSPECYLKAERIKDKLRLSPQDKNKNTSKPRSKKLK